DEDEHYLALFAMMKDEEQKRERGGQRNVAAEHDQRRKERINARIAAGKDSQRHADGHGKQKAKADAAKRHQRVDRKGFSLLPEALAIVLVFLGVGPRSLTRG